MINVNDTINNHFKVHKRASLLDILLEFDKFLDDLNLSKLSDLPELPEIQNIPEEAQISLLNEPSPSNSE